MDRFNIGDKVVYVYTNNKYDILTHNKVYTIYDTSTDLNCINIVNDVNKNCWYKTEKFITLKEFRTFKLKQLYE